MRSFCLLAKVALNLPFLRVNQLQDLVVGYMGVPKYPGISMTEHPQYITVRYVRKEKTCIDAAFFIDEARMAIF